MTVQTINNPPKAVDWDRISADAQNIEHYVNDTTPASLTLPGGGTRDNLAKIDADIRAKFGALNLRGAWVTATAYARSDVYTDGGVAYIVLTPHTSTTVAADLAAGYVGVYAGVLAPDLASTAEGKGGGLVGQTWFGSVVGTLADLAKSTGATLIGFVQAYAGAVAQSVAAKLSQDVTSYDFMTLAQIADVRSGAPTGDYTAVLQALFDVKDRSVIVKPGIYPTSAALLRGTSLSDRAHPIVMEPGATIRPAGTTYTALTVYPQPFTDGWAIKLESGVSARVGRPTINALKIDNLAGCKVDLIRVAGFSGYGASIDRMWDTFIGDCSIELCGNTAQYAFSLNTVNAGADTCNESYIARLQVEQSDSQAIYIHPTTLNVGIGTLHSERTDAQSAYTTWDFGTAACTFQNVRLNTRKDAAYDGVGVSIIRGGTWGQLRSEQSAGSTNAVELRVNAANLSMTRLGATTLRTGAGHNSPCTYINCSVSGTASLTDLAGTEWIGGAIPTLALSQSGGSATLATAARCVFENATITTVSLTGNPGATFRNTQVGSIGIGGAFLYENCVMPGAFSIGYQNWEARNCRFQNNLALDFSAGSGRLVNCDVAGTLTSPNASNGLVNINSRIGGAVTATLNAAPSVGTWAVGERTYRVTPVVGQPKSWVCTVAGTPGTWTSEGNL